MPKRTIRKRKGLFTQQELADRLGVHRNTIGRIERCPIDPRTLAYLHSVGYTVGFYPINAEGA